MTGPLVCCGQELPEASGKYGCPNCCGDKVGRRKPTTRPQEDNGMITFTIPGEARGKGRHRATTRGKFVRMYSDEKTASFENLVALFASQAMGGRPLIEGHCDVTMAIHVGIPASWSKRKQERARVGDLQPTGKPDIDNVVKAIMDALNGIAWKDDAQVTSLQVVKRYSAAPSTTVTIEHYPQPN